MFHLTLFRWVLPSADMFLLMVRANFCGEILLRAKGVWVIMLGGCMIPFLSVFENTSKAMFVVNFSI